ncbi:Uncharacterised protein [Collinsella intestinalis]|nr:Uncharacterised protein [Collinsella intestinalis]
MAAAGNRGVVHALNLGGGQHAQGVVRGEDAPAAGLDRAGLMRGGVRIGGEDRALEILGEGGDAHGVGGGATGNELHEGIRLTACLADERGGVLAVRIGAIPGCLFVVGADERLEHFRCGALGVIVAELVHVLPLHACGS